MATPTMSCAPVHCVLRSISFIAHGWALRIAAAMLPVTATAPLHAGDPCTEPGWVTVSMPEAGIGGTGSAGALALWRSQTGTGPAVIIAGSFAGAGINIQAKNIVAWNGQEHLPLGEGTNSWIDALQMVTHDDGSESLYAGGNFTMAGGRPAGYVARWDGTQWHPLGAGLNGRVHALAYIDASPLTGLYASGAFTMAGDLPVEGLARWDGAAWHAVGSGSNGVITQMAAGMHADGTPVLAVYGSFTEIDGVPAQHIAILEPEGFRALGNGIDGTVWSMLWWPADDGDTRNNALEPGTLIVGGHFPNAGDGFPVGVARWDGTAWTSIGAPFVGGTAQTLTTMVEDGRRLLVAGGSFLPIIDEPYQSVMRWDGDVWTGVGRRFSDHQGNGSMPRTLLGVDLPETNLIVGGTFDRSGSTTVRKVAKWNGTFWAPLSITLDNLISAFLPLPDKHDPSRHSGVIAGGAFTTADGVWLGGVGIWDGRAWQPLGTGFESDVPAIVPTVRALALYTPDPDGDPEIFAAGILRPAINHYPEAVARFNGVSWERPGDGVFAWVWGGVRKMAVFDAGDGPSLYVAGFALRLSDGTVTHIARWDGSTWHAMGVDGWNGQIYQMDVLDFGEGPRLVIAGTMSQVDGVPVDKIAQWDGHTWSAFPPLPAGYNIHRVNLLTLFDDGDGPYMYVGGLASGTYGWYSFLLRFSENVWTAVLGTWLGTIEVAHASLDRQRPALYLGGNFREVTSWDFPRDANGLAIFTCPGSVPLDPGVGWNEPLGVNAITTFHPAGSDTSSLLIGGDFRRHLETNDSRFAVRCLGSPDQTPPCPGDIVRSAMVDIADLQRFLMAWRIGTCTNALDFDGNGRVDSGDLLLLLKSWGPCP